MKVLRMLNLADNHFQGSIPVSFADNEALEVVYVYCSLLLYNCR